MHRYLCWCVESKRWHIYNFDWNAGWQLNGWCNTVIDFHWFTWIDWTHGNVIKMHSTVDCMNFKCIILSWHQMCAESSKFMFWHSRCRSSDRPYESINGMRLAHGKLIRVKSNTCIQYLPPTSHCLCHFFRIHSNVLYFWWVCVWIWKKKLNEYLTLNNNKIAICFELVKIVSARSAERFARESYINVLYLGQ